MNMLNVSREKKSAVGLGKLPGELRQRIYEFALSSSYYLRPCKNAVDFTKEEWCGLYGQGPKHREKMVRCRAFRRAKEDINQLRFVRRLLYHETASLEPKLNVLCFDQHSGNPKFPGQAAEFLEFVTHVPYPRKNISQLRDVYLDQFKAHGTFHSFGYWFEDTQLSFRPGRRHPLHKDFGVTSLIHDTPESLLSLARLCMENQFLRVDYILSAFKPRNWLSPVKTLTQFVFYIGALRNKDFSFLLKLGHGDIVANVDALLLAAGRFQQCFP